MTMAYVVVVNLCVLSESSMPLEGVLATCISSAFVTLVMGFWPTIPSRSRPECLLMRSEPHQQGFWSGRRESNPYQKLGKLQNFILLPRSKRNVTGLSRDDGMQGPRARRMSRNDFRGRRQDSFSEPFGATLEARITAFCHLAKLLTHLQQETWIAQSVGLRHPRAKKIRPSLVPLKQFTHEPDHRGYLPLSPLAFLLSPDQSGRWLVGAVGID
jgi:hypothetical protein